MSSTPKPQKPQAKVGTSPCNGLMMFFNAEHRTSLDLGLLFVLEGLEQLR
jgi:hypothetical protein